MTSHDYDETLLPPSEIFCARHCLQWTYF